MHRGSVNESVNDEHSSIHCYLLHTTKYGFLDLIIRWEAGLDIVVSCIMSRAWIFLNRTRAFRRQGRSAEAIPDTMTSTYTQADGVQLQACMIACH